MQHSIEIFRVFDPTKRLEVDYFRRELATQASDALATGPALLTLVLQALLRGAYHIEDTYGGDGSTLVSQGTAWRRRLAALRRLDEQSHDTVGHPESRLDASIIKLMDSGRLTFEIAFVLGRKRYDCERLLAARVARDSDWKQLEGSPTADALRLISKARIASSRERQSIRRFERFGDLNPNNPSLLLSTLAAHCAESANGSNTSRLASNEFLDTVVALLALPKFAEARKGVTLELWEGRHIHSIASFEQRVVEQSLANDELVGILATAVTIPYFHRLRLATAQELLEMGLIATAEQFYREEQQRTLANQAFLEAVAAMACLPCYESTREPITKTLLGMGIIDTPVAFESLVWLFQDLLKRFCDLRLPLAVHERRAEAYVRALMHSSAPPMVSEPSGTYAISRERTVDRAVGTGKTRRNL